MKITAGGRVAVHAVESAAEPEVGEPEDEPAVARAARADTAAALVSGGARPSAGHGGPRGYGEAAGRIPRMERHLALPAELVFVDRYGNEVATPEGRTPREDGYFPYRRDGHFQLTREAAAAFRALREEALLHGHNLRLNDGFRPDAEQVRRADRAGDAPDASARVARAGTSEHRTGRAFDIGSERTMPDGTPARPGLAFAIEHAALFGINHYDGPPGERMHFSYHVR